MKNASDFLDQLQLMSSKIQSQIGEALRNSPAAEIDKNVRAIMNQGFQKMDLVTREEFDIQSKILEKTRAKLEALEAKIDKLEKR
jgi:BMFP domain-containing protein YqiC